MFAERNKLWHQWLVEHHVSCVAGE